MSASSWKMWGFYLGGNCVLFAPSLDSNEAKMFPSVWLSVIFAWSLLEGMITPLLHTRTHKSIHTVLPLFFALSPLSLPFLSNSASPRCVCQWRSVVLCAGPTSGTAVSHKSASSFNRYRQGLFLYPWICATLLYLYFSLYPPPFRTHSLSVSPPQILPSFSFSPPLLCILILDSAEIF